MTAKEMFYEVGYIVKRADKTGVLYEPIDNDKLGIGFRYAQKGFIVLNVDDKNGVYFIGEQLHQAIMQQLKEIREMK